MKGFHVIRVRYLCVIYRKIFHTKYFVAKCNLFCDAVSKICVIHLRCISIPDRLDQNVLHLLEFCSNTIVYCNRLDLPFGLVFQVVDADIHM